MMIALFILSLCVALWGYAPALAETTRRYPQKDSLSIKFAVDDVVWSDSAPRSIRRKYVVAHMAVAVGLLLLAQIVQAYEANADRRVVGIVIGNLFAILIATFTMRNVYKHGL